MIEWSYAKLNDPQHRSSRHQIVMTNQALLLRSVALKIERSGITSVPPRNEIKRNDERHEGERARRLRGARAVGRLRSIRCYGATALG
jgi:hypothetical protein